MKSLTRLTIIHFYIAVHHLSLSINIYFSISNWKYEWLKLIKLREKIKFNIIEALFKMPAQSKHNLVACLDYLRRSRAKRHKSIWVEIK